MKLGVGYIEATSAWVQLFQQEGIPHRRVDLLNESVSECCSVLAVNRPLAGQEHEAVEAYVRAGGALLAPAAYVNGLCGLGSYRHSIDYLVSDGDSVFPELHMLDVGNPGYVSREANRLKTRDGVFGVFSGEVGGGVAVLLPFDPGELLVDDRAAEASFYARAERLPSERVSVVAKGEVRYLIHRGLEYLHHVRGLPYAHLWYYPGTARNVFAFRVDTDGAPKQDIDELCALARRSGVSMSWYLDVGSHEPWIGHFADMAGQELGLHCYEHRTFPDRVSNAENIRRALNVLTSSNIMPGGFTAPFGVWNPELAAAIDAAGFQYSSEFSYAYDTLPFFPEAQGERFAALQVPVHPVCIGSLMRVGFSANEMSDYFRSVASRKLLREEPLFFYHHPSHRNLSVLESIIGECTRTDVQSMTMGQFAKWWRSRLGCEMKLSLTDDILSAFGTQVMPSRGTDLRLRITRDGDEEVLVNLNREIALSSLTWRKKDNIAQPPGDIRRIREFDLRGFLGKTFTTVERKLR